MFYYTIYVLCYFISHTKLYLDYLHTIPEWKNSDYSEVPNELFINFRRGFAWNDDAYVKKTDFKVITYH